MKSPVGIDCPGCGDSVARADANCDCGYRARRRGVAATAVLAAVAIIARHLRGGGR